MDDTSGDDNKSQQSSSTPMPQRKSAYIKSQQSSSVMTPQGKSDDNKPSGKSSVLTPRQQREDFERRMRFNSALDQDKSPEDAARGAGISLGPGETLNSTEIMDLKYLGKPPKRRHRL